MIYLLQLRFKQLYRALREIGWLLLLLVAPMLVIFVLSLLERVYYHGTPVLAMLALALVFLLHAQRNDAGFLRLLNYSPWKVFLVEYSVAVIPFSLLAILFLSDWLNPLLIQTGVIVIAILPAGLMQLFQPKGGAALTWVPSPFFELKCALRKQFIWIALLYAIGLATSIFTGSMPLVSILLSLIATSAYDPIENRELLELTVIHKNWLSQKIFRQIKLFQLAMSPHYLLFLIFHFQYWYILLAIVLITTGLITFAIAYKYAHYYPGRQKANNQLPISLFTICLINPFFAPVSLVYLWVYLRRAKRNMKLYY